MTIECEQKTNPPTIL